LVQLERYPPYEQYVQQEHGLQYRSEGSTYNASHIRTNDGSNTRPYLSAMHINSRTKSAGHTGDTPACHITLANALHESAVRDAG